jgi:hypothetical protein
MTLGFASGSPPLHHMINVKYEKKNIKLAKYKKHETTRKKP